MRQLDRVPYPYPYLLLHSETYEYKETIKEKYRTSTRIVRVPYGCSSRLPDEAAARPLSRG